MGEPLRSPPNSLSPQQLKEASIYLGQVFSGLAALIQLNSENLTAAMLALPPELSRSNPEVSPVESNVNYSSIDSKFGSQLSDRLLGFSLGELPHPDTPRQPLTPAELTFSIAVLCHLCQQNQELIRRAVSLMEQMTREGRNPLEVTLLKDYNQRLAAYHPLDLTELEVSQLGAKILLDLLFYSSPYGQSRLWLRCTQPVNLQI